jgi:hypothetical protein
MTAGTPKVTDIHCRVVSGLTDRGICPGEQVGEVQSDGLHHNIRFVFHEFTNLRWSMCAMKDEYIELPPADTI